MLLGRFFDLLAVCPRHYVVNPEVAISHIVYLTIWTHGGNATPNILPVCYEDAMLTVRHGRYVHRIPLNLAHHLTTSIDFPAKAAGDFGADRAIIPLSS